MPDDSTTLDLDAIARSAGAIKETSPNLAALDLDAIGRSAPADDLIARERRKASLRGEMAALQPEAQAADIAMRFDPLGEFFRGLRASGNVLAGAGEDVALGVAAPFTGQPPSLENVRSALTTFEPTPAEKALAQQPGVAAGLTRGVVGAVKTVPVLAAGAALTGLTKLPPEVIYPALFGGETYEHTGDVLQSAKAATIGAAYPVLGRAVKPLAGALISRLGAAGSPTAQKAIETTVDQALMQAFTHVISIPEYAQMSPEQRAGAIAENTGNILVFALPRVLGYAAGQPSEYEGTIREEAARIQGYLGQDRLNELRSAATPQAQTEAAIRTGLIQPEEAPARPTSEFVARSEAERQAGQEDIERTFGAALRTGRTREVPDRIAAAERMSRRLAAEAARAQGIPVGVNQPTTEVTSATQTGPQQVSDSGEHIGVNVQLSKEGDTGLVTPGLEKGGSATGGGDSLQPGGTVAPEEVKAADAEAGVLAEELMTP